MRFRSDLIAATAFGLLVGAVVVMTAEGLSRETSPDAIPRVRSSTPVKLSKTAPPTSRVLLAWAPGGLPPGAAERVATLPGIERVTTVVAGMDWLPSRRPGYELPFEAAAIEPDSFGLLFALHLPHRRSDSKRSLARLGIPDHSPRNCSPSRTNASAYWNNAP